MRISTQMIYEKNMRNITDGQSLALSYGEQVSTGKRVNRPSDDPNAALQQTLISQAQALNSQYKQGRIFAKQQLSQTEGILQQTVLSLQSAQEKIVNAGSSGTLNDDDRAALATQLKGIRDQLLNQANSTDDNGRYIFAGYKTQTPPFSDDSGGVIYKGGTTPITQQVDTSRTMMTGFTGDQISNHISSNAIPEPDGTPGETNLFNMLDSAITALNTPMKDLDEAGKKELDDVIAKTNRGLSNSLDNISKVRAQLGVQLSEIDTLNQQGDERALEQSDSLSQVINIDWSSAISLYSQQKSVLEASYQVFQDMQGMSLFQYMK